MTIAEQEMEKWPVSKKTNWLEERLQNAEQEMNKWPKWKKETYKNNTKNPSYVNQ